MLTYAYLCPTPTKEGLRTLNTPESKKPELDLTKFHSSYAVTVSCKTFILRLRSVYSDGCDWLLGFCLFSSHHAIFTSSDIQLTI